MLRLVSATANPGKLAEIRLVLGDEVEVAARPDAVPDVVEDAGTYLGNAQLKARAIVAATGEAAVADDSGLDVDAIPDELGVETAYYAGPEGDHAANRAKLLGALAGVPAAGRRARFRSLALIVWPDGSETVAEGSCEGMIADAERGEHGFGYDPLFVPDGGDGRSFAEMTIDEKHGLSHRRQAFERLLEQLRREGRLA